MAAADRDSGSDFELTTPDFLPHNSLIKPTLDCICAEIEKSLPSIDFEISDVSSEEDVPIFHRALRTPTLEEDEDSDSYLDLHSSIPKLEHLKFADPHVTRLPTRSAACPGETAGSVKTTGSSSQYYNNNNSKSAGVSASGRSNTKSIGISTHVNTPGYILSQSPVCTPLRDNWVGNDEDCPLDEEFDINIPSPTISPRSEKRLEVPELSPSDDKLHSHKLDDKGHSKDDKGHSKDDKGHRQLIKGEGDSVELVSKYLPVEPLTLKLDSIDIDQMVTGTLARITDGTSVITDTSAPRPPAEKEGPSLIQRLAQLSIDQSGTQLTGVDPSSGALRRKNGGLKDIKTAHNISVSSEAVITRPEVQPRVAGKDLVNLPTSELTPSPPSRKREEPETIFIDLRRFDENQQQQRHSIERVQRVLRISPQDQSESSSDEDDTLSWVEQRQLIKQSLQQTGSLPEQLNANQHKQLRPQAAAPANRPRTQAQKLATPTQLTTPRSTAHTAPVTSPTVAGQLTDKDEQIKQDKLNAARKLREKREAERQSRIRLGQRLDAVSPTLSNKGHCNAAETTPTIFDIESSYEPAPQTMPFDLLEDVELVLLSVHLSSNGEMVLHRGAAHRSIDRGEGLSASYTTLVTWLLSLVPDNFDFLKTRVEEPVFASAPFYVLGMQQMFTNGELQLSVAVTPVEKFTPRDAPGRTKAKTKKRDEIKDSSPFQQILTKYFSVNTLHHVCLWLQDMVSMEVTKGNQPDGEFVYRPPLPSITTRPLSTFLQIKPDTQAAIKVLKSQVGFFWQTLETEESTLDLNLNDDALKFDTQNTMSLVYKKVYRDPRSMMGILNRVLQEGLDLAGLRLLYPTSELMDVSSRNPGLTQIDNEMKASPLDMLNHIGPIVSLAIRGTYARSIWLDAIGPSDPALARRTDPNSLCAMYGGESRDECLLFCPRNPDRIHSELCRWFGGRVPSSGVIDIGTSSREFSGRKSKKANSRAEIPANCPVATLTALARSDIIVVISPLVPSKCLGLIFATCQRRGYQLHGVKRCRLSTRRATSLGLMSLPLSVFVGEGLPTGSDNQYGEVPLSSPGPVTLLLLTKENAYHTAASLIEAFMIQMSLQGVLGDLADYMRTSGVEVELGSSLMFHAVPYTDTLINSLGGDFSKVPDSDLSSAPGYITPRLHTNPELEQIIVLTLTGNKLLQTFGLFLGRLLGLVPYSQVPSPPSLKRGLELLGVKWLPSLSLQHAKELTPFEVGEQAWKPSLHKLTSEPAVVLVLRGVNAFKLVESFLAARVTNPSHHPQSSSVTLETMLSPTPEMAYRQVTMFFNKWELHPDPSARAMLKYLPPLRQQTSTDPTEGAAYCDNNLYNESLLRTMLSGPRPITTVLICKPDVVQRHLAKLLRRVAQDGFSIVGIRLLVLDHQMALTAIPEEDRKDDILCSMHVDFLTAAPSLVLCLQRENAVKKLCDLIGPSDPKEARRFSSGLWRGTFGSDPISNGLHGSCDYEAAVTEMNLFFPDGLCCKQTQDLNAEQVVCPCEDSEVNLAAYRKREVMCGQPRPATDAIQPAHRNTGNTCKEFNLHVSALTQTNCIVLTPPLLHHVARSKKLPFVEVLDHLLTKGFEMVGARMMWFTEEQAQNFLHINDAGSFTLVPLLRSGPSVILALQRDNAVMAFDSLLGSTYEKDSVLAKYGHQILRPKDTSYADRLLCYFFQDILPAAHARIVTKS